MNVSFKAMRRSGDKAYILSEISGYDERLPVVLAASTDSGARIPSDTFPYCDIDDSIALQGVLADGALASHGTAHAAPRACASSSSPCRGSTCAGGTWSSARSALQAR